MEVGGNKKNTESEAAHDQSAVSKDKTDVYYLFSENQ